MPKKQTRYKHKKSNKRGGLLWPWTKKQQQPVQLVEDEPEQEQESQSQAQVSPQQEPQEPVIDKQRFLQSFNVKKTAHTGWHVNFQFYIQHNKVHVFNITELKAYEQFKEFWQDNFTAFKIRNEQKGVDVYALVDVHISNHVYRFAALNHNHYFVRNYTLLCIVDYTQYKQDSFMVNDSGNKDTQLTNAAAIHEIEGLQMRQMRPQLAQDLLFKGSRTPTKAQSPTGSSTRKHVSPTGSPTHKHVSPPSSSSGKGNSSYDEVSSSSSGTTSGTGNHTYDDEVLSEFEIFYKQIKADPELRNVDKKEIMECLKVKNNNETENFNISDKLKGELSVFANKVRSRKLKQPTRFDKNPPLPGYTNRNEIMGELRPLYHSRLLDVLKEYTTIVEYLKKKEHIKFTDETEGFLDELGKGQTYISKDKDVTKFQKEKSKEEIQNIKEKESLKAELNSRIEERRKYINQFPKRQALDDLQTELRNIKIVIAINERNKKEEKEVINEKGKYIYDPVQLEIYYTQLIQDYNDKKELIEKQIEKTKVEAELEAKELLDKGIVYKSESDIYDEEQKLAQERRQGKIEQGIQKSTFTRGHRGFKISDLKNRKTVKLPEPNVKKRYLHYAREGDEERLRSVL